MQDDQLLLKLWKSQCLAKLKVLCWLLVNNRLNTKDMMQHKHWHIDDVHDCVLCTQGLLEDLEHLFFSSAFARDCWDDISVPWDFSEMVRQRLELASHASNHPHFWEIFASTAWSIWKERNDLIFNGVTPSMDNWRRRAKQDFLLHQYRVKKPQIQQLTDYADRCFN